MLLYFQGYASNIRVNIQNSVFVLLDEGEIQSFQFASSLYTLFPISIYTLTDLVDDTWFPNMSFLPRGAIRMKGVHKVFQPHLKLAGELKRNKSGSR